MSVHVARKCPQCDREFFARASHVNRAIKMLAPLYCGKACASAARRIEVDAETKKALKAEYDSKRRDALADELKAQKRAHYEANRDRILARMVEYRKKRMPQHVEYCRRPEYKAYKVEYDKARNESEYGEWADAWRLLQDLEQEIRSQASAYERRVANGYYLRTAQKRRRELWQLKKNCNSTPAT
jgi:hypothetical protein